ncbi:AraC family transcriptional regulator [Granulosicoccus sp. 3-233]|uniref:AraC family transcriptional regulator n=1 Tax=Granulosicoccus sp. 3-233 TaxID=3417969 RepID=UPI003D33E921
MKTTQQRHAQRIQRVIDHIHDHLAEDIDSATVAEVAHLSAYHWHRIYVAVTGESAVATLRRVRLQRTATELLRDDRPVAEIAAECGFDNLQAFTRLFSRTYGMPPGRFRHGGKSGIQPQPSSSSNARIGAAADRSGSAGDAPESETVGPVVDESSDARSVTIAERAPLRLIGLWHQGDYHDIGRVFEKIMAAAEIESWPRSETFTVGVYFDDPDVIPEERCRSFAGIPVPEDFRTPDGYETQNVPGGLHASCLHVGPYAMLPRSYRWLYREWLRDAAQDARDEPCYEAYLNTPYNTPPAELETLICMPLEEA